MSDRDLNAWALEMLRAETGGTAPTTTQTHACFCVGRQPGQPACPCQMRSVRIQNGRYVQVTDLGPAPEADRDD